MYGSYVNTFKTVHCIGNNLLVLLPMIVSVCTIVFLPFLMHHTPSLGKFVNFTTC